MSNTTSTGGISDRLADEAKMGALDLANLPKLPSIPSAASDDVGALRRTITAMKMLLDVREGRAGSAMDKHLTLRDLLDAGLTSVSALGRVSGGTGTTINNTVTGGTGGSGAGYQDMRPVLGTPPTLTGLAAQGAFKNIVLTWVMPPYANHAYVEVWRNSVDVLGTAAVVGTTVDNLYVDASGSLGSSYFYWVRAYNIEGTAGAFNAVSGAPAGLLKIGSTDLGPLVVLAGNLADGSVTAAKVLAGQIDTTKFASGLEPITLITGSTVPATLSTTTIYLTGTGKLYRWDGAAYTAAVATSDLAGQISAAQLNVTVGGGNLLSNSSMEGADTGLKPLGWTAYNNANISTTYLRPAGRMGGSAYSLRANAASVLSFGVLSSTSLVDSGVQGGVRGGWQPGATYVLSWYAKKVNGASWSQMYLGWNVGPSGTVWLSQPTLTTSWQRYAVRITWAGSVEALGALFISAAGGTASGDEIHIDDVQVELADVLTAYAPRADEILPGTITATEVADNAITTPKIIAGAVVTGHMTAGTIIGTVISAGTLGADRIVAGSITSDRMTANTITGDRILANSLDAGKIVANTITAGQIQAGAIRATELAAGAVTTDKLVVTGRGAALNDDPGFTDPSAWALGKPSITFASGATVVGSAGSIYLRGAGGTLDATAYSRTIQIDPAKTYSLTANLYADTGNNRNIWLFVDMYDASDAHITGATTGWGGTLSGYVYGGVTPPGVFTRQGAQFGAGTTRPIPANVATVKVGVWFQYSSFGSSSVAQACQDLRLTQAADYSLIVDGAIIAGKIAVNAIVAGDGAIKNAAITNALIANLAVDDAKIASLNVDKVTAGTMSASFITARTITADHMLVGLMAADNVLTRNLTVRDASGNVLLSSGVNLPAANIAPAAGWLNSSIAISSGAISGIGSGSGTVVDNSLVTATAIGAVKTDASNAPGAILNSNVTLSASGVLSGGSGAVTVVGLDNSIVRSGFPINPGNVTTYISGAAIGLANINTASIGTLSALSADMGTVTAGTLTLNSSGHIKSGQTDFNIGTGFWLGLASGTPKFSIGNPSGENMVWDGAHLTLTDPTFQPFTASITGGDLTVSVWYGTQDYGSRKVEVSGGKAPYSYFWVVVNGAMTSSWKFYDSYLRVITELAISQVWPAGGSNAATVTLRGSGFTFTNRARVGCFVSDANGRVTFATFLLTATHADSPGGGGGGGGDGGAGP